MIIPLIHAKCGVGKTTSAIYLATAAARAGYDVEVWDADPQGSSLQWAQYATEYGNTLPFPVKKADVETIRRMESYPTKIQLIDTPSRDLTCIQAAIDKADSIIIPTRVSPMDIKFLWPTLEVIEGKPVRVLLTLNDRRSKRYAAVQNILEEKKVPVFASVIPCLQEIIATFGGTPRKMHGYDDVFKELMDSNKNTQHKEININLSIMINASIKVHIN